VPLISKQPRRVKKEQLNVRIDPAVGETLRLYCLFIESTQHHVVEQTLKYAFAKDKEFQAWVKQQETASEDEGA
jgi:hypothetical protein